MPRRTPQATVSDVNYVLFDMGSLRFGMDAERRMLVVRTANMELLGSAAVPDGRSLGEAAFQLLDDLLDRCILPRPGAPRVAFYNPITAEVAIGAVPNTQVFSCGDLLELDPAGSAATLVDGVLNLGKRLLLPKEPSLDGLRASFVAAS